MKLKKMIIQNYRQFKDITINYHDNLTILAGANNSGKTSLVEIYNTIFNDNEKKFLITDISITHLKQSIKNLCTIIKSSFTSLSITENISNELIANIEKEYVLLKKQEKDGIEKAIIVAIEISYDKNESISYFSDYLMELDENDTSFYFINRLEFNFSAFKKLLIYKAEKIIPYLKNQEDISLNSLISNLYEEALENKIYFSDKYYNFEEVMTPKEFRKLFHFGYIKATRQLNDEKSDTYFSLSKEILANFKLTNEWEELKNTLPEDISNSINLNTINNQIKENSLNGLENILKDISSILDYEPSKFFLKSEINEEILIRFLLSILRVNYEFEDNNILGEFTQGLGVSNLIFICLRIDRFIKKYDYQKVNFFVIEEPEAHMHPQMERILVNYISEALTMKEKKIQGIITTHSHEIVKTSQIDNIRILRGIELFNSKLYDMSEFKLNLNNDEERYFFTFLFSINYSNLIFANKIIMYEGDTEKLYLENLLNNELFRNLSQQYISFLQVGGAYAHWYRKLIYFLEIKTLILTDIDYLKGIINIEEILKSESTNEGLKEYYRDKQTLILLKSKYLIKCVECENKEKNCYYFNSSHLQIEKARNIEQKVCKDIEVDDEIKMLQTKPIDIKKIYSWEKEEDSLLRVCTQSVEDGYARTLEEAMLCKLFNIKVDDFKTKEEWKELKKETKLKFSIPNTNILSNNTEKISVRDILCATENKKTDFMYSVILNNKQLEMLPNYIKEGLDWLVRK
ncbi:AAA family ATPase [Fusobacterium ulcerans]|uniref:AAA family ATPase n=1 Tax=Fusobacterium ulcerans TaxID=861 RepID=UPI001D0A0090|nr:AAA family ATPase [Fusobacterium ulcerans]MCB8564500.1 AAA family ATPase [Fusobacterium ulcerans]MCB8648671.1 AAA family ATPase [Fusobacterium ulcerans]